jgi:hypothetical protein
MLVISPVLVLASVLTCDAPKISAITKGKATKPKPNKVSDFIDKAFIEKLLLRALIAGVLELLTVRTVPLLSAIDWGSVS